MKRISVPLTALLVATLWVNTSNAQQPPPPPPPGAPAPPPAANAYGPGLAASPAYSGKGTIRAFNLGPEGETNGMILNDGTAVFFPPRNWRTAAREHQGGLPNYFHRCEQARSL